MSTTFHAANQAKLALKMKCSQHAWYKSSWVEVEGTDWIVVISVVKVDDKVRKLIPPVYEGVSVKTMNSK